MPAVCRAAAHSLETLMESKFLKSARSIIALALLLSAAMAGAQTWKPEKQVEIIIGTSAGGPQDRMGRAVQRILQDKKLVATQLNVINKAGGGGAVALSYLNQHAGDGHYVAINALSTLTNHITGKSTIAPTDLTPLAMMGAEYVGVTVRAESPLKTGKDVLDQLRKDPSSLSVAVGTALGNATHLSFVLAMKAGGVDIKKLRTVVFGSGGDSMTALLGGHVDVAASAPSAMLPQVQAGKLRIIVIGAPKRLGGELAKVPTWKELGVNSAFELWRGLAGPKGMTRAQIQFWDGALGALVKTDDWKKELAENQVEDIYKNSADTGKQWKEEYDEVKGILTELGLAK
jgi:putative tricarboxylic transport membrane protein